MPVDSTHPEYDAALPSWTRARDVLAGEDAVKAAGEKYLPRLDSQSDEEYASYRKRAAFFNATARTLDEYLDLIFRRAPQMRMPNPEQLRGFVDDSDGWGTDFDRYARRVVSEVLSVGRGGTLMLMDAESGRPWITFWQAGDILNWEVEQIGERMVLTRVLLRDAKRLCVLKLEREATTKETTSPQPSPTEPVWPPAEREDPGESEKFRFVVELWAENDQNDPPPPDGFPLRQTTAGQAGATGGGWRLISTEVPLRKVQPLPFIPFVFHGPRHSRPEPDRLPLADIIAANLDHYRLDADYKHGLHFTALPTAWVSGFDKAAPLRIGSSSAWVSEVPGASAGFLEFSGRGLAHLERAIEKVERRMATSVAAILRTPESGFGEGQLCGLGSIVASLNESLSRVLRLAQWWIEGGELEQLAASFAMNTDLDAHAMSGDEITAVVAAWRAGAISRDTMLERLKRGEVLPDGRSVAQERALIHGNPGGRK